MNYGRLSIQDSLPYLEFSKTTIPSIAAFPEAESHSGLLVQILPSKTYILIYKFSDHHELKANRARAMIFLIKSASLRTNIPSSMSLFQFLVSSSIKISTVASHMDSTIGEEIIDE